MIAPTVSSKLPFTPEIDTAETDGASRARIDPTRMWAGLREREVLGVIIKLDFAFGLEELTELLLEEGVFMGGISLSWG